MASRTSAETRIAMTGGLGFVGQALLPRIQDQAPVLVVDNLHPQVHADRSAVDHLRSTVEFLEGDVTDPAVADVVADFAPTVLIHLAAETGTGQSMTESRRHAHVNATGTATLLDGLSRAGHRPNRIVLASSRAVYGEGRWVDASGHPFYALPRGAAQLQAAQWTPRGADGQVGQEPQPHSAVSTEPRPANVYAATKLAQEHLSATWCAGFGVQLCILRLQNVFGSGQSLSNPYTGVLTLMARQALRGEQIHVFEGGGILRDFVHITDVVRALTAAISRPSLPGLLLVDVGSGQGRSLLEVAGLLTRLARAPAPEVTNEFRVGDVRAAFADIADAERLLGYAPQVPLEEGLRDLLHWVQSSVEA